MSKSLETRECPTTGGGVFAPERESDYQQLAYDYRGRFLSYWHQAQEVAHCQIASRRTSVLEIGPGNGFLTDYLRKRGFRVETLDIDPLYAPDHVGSVHEIPLADGMVDVACAFEVLEHLPFDMVTRALVEMARVARRRVLFSVPDVRYSLELEVGIFSAAHRIHRVFSLPRLTNRALPPPGPGGHQWEIGRPGYSLRRVREAVPPVLRIEREYRVPGNPIHHMFALEKHGGDPR